MKQIIIMIIILIVIFSGSLYIQNFLRDTSMPLVSKLEEIKNDVQNGNIEDKEVKEKSEEIYKEWEDISSKWAIIVLHNEMDLIEMSLIKMRANVEMGNPQDSIQELETSIFLLEHIGEKEKTSLKNIF